MQVFKVITVLGIRKTKKYKNVAKMIKDRRMNSMNLQIISKNIVKGIIDKESVSGMRQCGVVDALIDDDMSQIPVYESKCDGIETTTESIDTLPSVLTMLGSEIFLLKIQQTVLQ